MPLIQRGWIKVRASDDTNADDSCDSSNAKIMKELDGGKKRVNEAMNSRHNFGYVDIDVTCDLSRLLYAPKLTF